jgi:hypothetical protein
MPHAISAIAPKMPIRAVQRVAQFGWRLSARVPRSTRPPSIGKSGSRLKPSNQAFVNQRYQPRSSGRL